uniref:RNA-directed DNA polymerase-like protein n=1 Tax=Steinernema glaseri TaxID=37863 RepID=A0A1I7YZW7_9BILA
MMGRARGPELAANCPVKAYLIDKVNFQDEPRKSGLIFLSLHRNQLLCAVRLVPHFEDYFCRIYVPVQRKLPSSDKESYPLARKVSLVLRPDLAAMVIKVFWRGNQLDLRGTLWTLPLSLRQ